MFDLIQRFNGITYSRQQCQYPSEGCDDILIKAYSLKTVGDTSPQVCKGFACIAFVKMDAFALWGAMYQRGK
jgi:hypothetical protein